MTFHLLFTAVAGAIDVSILGRHPLRSVANIFRSADNAVMHYIGVGIDRTGHIAVELVVWVAYTLTMIGVAIAALTYEMLLYAKRAAIKSSPAQVQKAVAPLITAKTAPVARTKVIADSRVPALEREIAAVNARVDALQHAATLPAPVTVPRTLPRVGELEQGLEWAKGKIGRLSKYATVAGLVGLTAAVLGRLGLGWTRCSNVRRVGKNVCGMDAGLLESLLAGTALVTGTVSIVEFAKALQAIEGEVVAGVRGFVREI